MTPYLDEDHITIYHGDMREVVPELPEPVSYVLTDPPYGLKFMGKDWDHSVPGLRFWKIVSDACKPGAMMMAFGGTRTHHRLMCAIEDAGWEIRDCLMWLYGQGFPKSQNISKALDRAAGAEREIVGHAYPLGRENRTASQGRSSGVWAERSTPKDAMPAITAPTTEAAKLWDGYETGLKPAYEPIVLAMEKLDGTFARNALEHGVAGLNVDKGRILNATGWRRKTNHWKPPEEIGIYGGGKGYPDEMDGEGNSKGRFPANVILTHHPDCVQMGTKKVKGNGRPNNVGNVYPDKSVVFPGRGSQAHKNYHTSPDGTETIEDWRCVEGCPVRMLDEQSGYLHGSGHRNPSHRKRIDNKWIFSSYGIKGDRRDSFVDFRGGGASRFFKQCQYGDEDWICHEDCALRMLDEQSGIMKSHAIGKNKGTKIYNKTGKEATAFASNHSVNIEHLDPGGASRFFYCAKASRSERGEYNRHPTVKPLKLLSYLLKLLAPPTKGIGLDPFMGSGSTLVAAYRLGLPFVGIEMDEASCEIAARRLREESR